VQRVLIDAQVAGRLGNLNAAMPRQANCLSFYSRELPRDFFPAWDDCLRLPATYTTVGVHQALAPHSVSQVRLLQVDLSRTTRAVSDRRLAHVFI